MIGATAAVIAGLGRRAEPSVARPGGVIRGRWDVSAYVNNLTDERALLAIDQERGTLARVGYLTTQPRTFGVTLRLNY